MVANPPRVGRTKRLEGSQTSPRRQNSGRLCRAGRFTRWQLYRLAAGGSQTSPNRLKLREATSGRPGITQRNVLPTASIPRAGHNGP
jgi:hypothetical protein